MDTLQFDLTNPLLIDVHVVSNLSPFKAAHNNRHLCAYISTQANAYFLGQIPRNGFAGSNGVWIFVLLNTAKLSSHLHSHQLWGQILFLFYLLILTLNRNLFLFIGGVFLDSWSQHREASLFLTTCSTFAMYITLRSKQSPGFPAGTCVNSSIAGVLEIMQKGQEAVSHSFNNNKKRYFRNWPKLWVLCEYQSCLMKVQCWKLYLSIWDHAAQPEMKIQWLELPCETTRWSSQWKPDSKDIK